MLLNASAHRCTLCESITGYEAHPVLLAEVVLKALQDALVLGTCCMVTTEVSKCWLPADSSREGQRQQDDHLPFEKQCVCINKC